MKTAPLRFKIASPCPEKWEAMRGDDDVRFCDRCSLNVYNFSSLTTDQLRALVLRHEGRQLCGRLFRRADGTVLTADCPVGAQRLVRGIAVAFAAILTLVFCAASLRLPRASCGGARSGLSDAISSRTRAVEASLRRSESFGRLIEWIDPTPTPSMIVGKIAAPAPPPPPT